MKILIVSQYFHPENFRINDLASGLKNLGHEVTVLTGIPNYPQGKFFDGYGYLKPREELWNGIKIIRCALTPRRSSRFLHLLLNYVSFALSASIAVFTRLTGKYDAIFVFQVSPITVGIPAIVAKHIKKAPIFFWVLDLWPESVLATTHIKSKKLISLLTALTRWTYRHCDKVMVQSKGFYEHAKRMGVRDSQLQFFPNWAEELYVPSHVDEKIDASLPIGFRIMFAGNIGEAQDFDAILKAAFTLKEQAHIQWVIVGDGKQKAYVEHQIHLLGLQNTVHLIGQKPVQMMPAYFASADALLVSLKNEEIFASTIPGKIPSYLACAKPVLGMLNGEGANIINEAGAGLTCHAGDSHGLVEIVLKISGLSSHQLACLGNNGLRYYQQTFDRASLFKKLEEEMSTLATK
jgi:colanic acid biosynthesis glycosyl transferase WcaI